MTHKEPEVDVSEEAVSDMLSTLKAHCSNIYGLVPMLRELRRRLTAAEQAQTKLSEAIYEIANAFGSMDSAADKVEACGWRIKAAADLAEAQLTSAQAVQRERELALIEYMGNDGHWSMLAGSSAESILLEFNTQARKGE